MTLPKGGRILRDLVKRLIEHAPKNEPPRGREAARNVVIQKESLRWYHV
jgi:hypothetical protein